MKKHMIPCSNNLHSCICRMLCRGMDGWMDGWMEYVVTPTMVAGLVDPCTNLTEVYNMRGAGRSDRICEASGDDEARRRWDGRSWEVSFVRAQSGRQASPWSERKTTRRGPEKITKPTNQRRGLSIDDRRRLPCPFLPSTGRVS